MKVTQTIWKFPVEITERQAIEVRDAVVGRLLSVGVDPDGEVCIWAIVTPGRGLVDEIAVGLYGTGHLVPDGHMPPFLGTAVAGPFVWHIFAEAAT